MKSYLLTFKSCNSFQSSFLVSFHRLYSTPSARKALVLGLYKGKEQDTSFTTSTRKYLDGNPDLRSRLDGILGSKFEKGATRTLYDQTGADVVCLTNLGESVKEVYDELEGVYVSRENIRGSISKSIRVLSEQGVTQVAVDGCGDPEASAEGAFLADYVYDEFKTTKKDPVEITPYDLSAHALGQWSRGRTLAEAQNFARWLMESPSNFLTPTKFAAVAKERLPGSCEVHTHDKTWIQNESMNAFLAVAQGSTEEPVFLEVEYRGDKSQDQHVALVGKGVTFDTGGISIKPSAKMDAMRADMGGAACVLASVWALAKLELPVNFRAYIPLCDNMPSGSAMKPGDVVRSRSGKTIQIDNTDAEGRLLLADALHYACSHKPVCVLDVATLTGAIAVALGAGATGTFSNSTTLWKGLQQAGAQTGDRVWRMPLYKLYTSHVNKPPLADLHNIGSIAGQAGSCTAAAFLQEFVSCDHWAHLDIAGVMDNIDQVPYLSKGMAGRPTRTIIEFMEKMRLSNFEG